MWGYRHHQRSSGASSLEFPVAHQPDCLRNPFSVRHAENGPLRNGSVTRAFDLLGRPRLIPSPGVSILVDATAIRDKYFVPRTRLRGRPDSRRSFWPQKCVINPTCLSWDDGRATLFNPAMPRDSFCGARTRMRAWQNSSPPRS